MSKELEAFNKILGGLCGEEMYVVKEIHIVETALKEYKELKKIVKQQINTIGYYENLALKNKLESDKKLKAFDIIKREIDIIGLVEDGIKLNAIEITKEEYDLLKEVLL